MKKLTSVVLFLFFCSYVKAQTWSNLGSGMGGASASVHAIALYNGEIYASGRFDSAGGNPVSNIAKWNGTVWSPVGSGTNGDVFALAVYNGELYAGGLFDSAGGIPASNIAKWNGSIWSSLGTGVDWYVFTLLDFNGELYVGGLFDYAGGIYTYGIAKWDGVAWDSLGQGTGPGVEALAVYNGELYAAGTFGAMSTFSQNIARWNGNTWLSVGGFGIGGDVYDLCVYNGELYVGGWFFSADTNTILHIVRWDGTNWTSAGGAISFNDAVKSLAVYNGELYAGGTFWEIDGNPVNGIARWNGTSWSVVGTGAEVLSYTLKLLVINSELYAGGSFNAFGGAGNRIAKWNVGNCSANYSLFPDTSLQHTYWIVDNSIGAAPLSYIWNWGDNTYDSIANPSHTYASAGFYDICLSIIDAVGCSQTYCNNYNLMRMDANNAIITVSVIPAGISDNFSEQDFSVSPNPTADELRIENGKIRIEKMEIYNVTGQKILSQQPQTTNLKLQTINVSALPPGMYFLKFTTETGIQTAKFVKSAGF